MPDAPASTPETPVLLPSASFRYCPRCGQGPVAPPEAPLFSCPACGFHYHFNPAVAAGVIAQDSEGRVLLVRRAKDPARGLLGVPGGFVDVGENAEESARREAREETGVEVESLRFLGSWPNLYAWRGVAYPVVDIYFTARACGGQAVSARHEVDEVLWLRLDEIDPELLAFPTTRAAFARYREERGQGREGASPAR
jgi:ADP-ribose pyrophosphatase YjhB (NUDIX family)